MSDPREPSFVVRQEADRLDRRRIRGVSAAAALILAVSLGVTAWLMGRTTGGAALTTAPGGPAMPAQINTVEATLILATERGITLRNEQRESLSHYGWVDRDAGIARIPVDRAMDMLAAEPPPADRGTR